MKTKTGQYFTLKEDWAYFSNDEPIELVKTKSRWKTKIPEDAVTKPNYFKGDLVFVGTFWTASQVYFEFVRSIDYEEYLERRDGKGSFLISGLDMEDVIPYMEYGRISGYFGWKKSGIGWFSIVYLGDEI